MSVPFVWFDNVGPKRAETTAFLANLFGWVAKDMGSVSMLSQGEQLPFAGTTDEMADVQGWVPYVEVPVLSDAVRRAGEYGADILAENLQGPAGTASFIRDPGGAVLALWQRA